MKDWSPSNRQISGKIHQASVILHLRSQTYKSEVEFLKKWTEKKDKKFQRYFSKQSFLENSFFEISKGKSSE